MKRVALFGSIGALLIASVAAPLSVEAQQGSSGTGAPAMPPGFEIPKDMTPYFLAIYVKGPKHSTAQTAENMELTKSHLKYIRRMIEEKKYMFAGPFVENGDNQGIAIVAAPTARDAQRIADGDPAIASGHMAVRLQPVMLPSLSSLVVKY